MADMTQTASSTPTRRIPSLSIRYAIPGILALLIIVAVSITGYLAYRSGQEAVGDLAKRLISEKADRIDEHVRSFLQIPSLFNDIDLASIKAGNLNPSDYAQLQPYFWNMVHVSAGAPYLYYGTPTDDFVGVDSDLNRTGKPVFKIRDATTSGNRVTYWLDDAGLKTGVIESSKPYPTTQRDWYKAAIKADKPTWSPIYVFAAAKVLGISAVAPIHDDAGKITGVLGIDLTLDELSTFLNKMDVSPNGEAVIVERNGDMVATSTSDPAYTTSTDAAGNEVQNRLNIADSQSALMSASGKQLAQQFGGFDKITERQQITFELNGRTEYAQIAPITDARGLDWLIIVIVPADDFLGPVYESARTTALLGGLVMVFAAVLGYLLASWIIRPVIIVSDVARSIEQEKYELDPLTRVSGRTDELGQLARVFERMAREIYQRVETLKQQVSLLKIEIDEARKERQVAEIVESDFFSDLQSKARSMRERKHQAESGAPAPDKPKGKTTKGKK